MRISRELQLPPEREAELYYVTLLMDAGCTAWTSRIAAYVQGDEITARRVLFFYRDPRDPLEVFNWLRRYMASESRFPVRA